jgi:hypothetical protein
LNFVFDPTIAAIDQKNKIPACSKDLSIEEPIADWYPWLDFQLDLGMLQTWESVLHSHHTPSLAPPTNSLESPAVTRPPQAPPGKKNIRAIQECVLPTRLWAPISSRNAQSQVTQRLSLTPRLSLASWNIDAFSSRPISRSKLILDYILDRPIPPDIIILQEVTSGVRDSLGDPRVHSAFLVTDAEDRTSFENVPFQP